MQLGLEHSYAALPAQFHTAEQPAGASAPRLLAWNHNLAAELGLSTQVLQPQAAQLFSGRQLPDDAHPIAMAYAGHQYAHFVPSLGDGRAILLGERRDTMGRLRDLQLKGAGRTRWSRSGDGLAAIGPMLREFLVSEAMHALGIPTTRSLAVVATGDRVQREELLPGAVLTRVAASHVRVGTFEYFAARSDHAAVGALLHYCIARIFPEHTESTTPALDFLRTVTARQASLIAQWMSVGFIHGVMNTDNMAISGETIDYGPCAFMDHYHPQTVFSSIDHRGRYSYGNQPAIAQWNLARLAESLLPAISSDTTLAVEQATAVVQPFIEQFDAAFLANMRSKLGLHTAADHDAKLVSALLDAMKASNADFTQTFRALAEAIEPAGDALLRTHFGDQTAIGAWLEAWRARLPLEPLHVDVRRAAMRRVNPAFIARNHRVEAALTAASERDDLQPFQTMLQLVQRPYDDHPGRDDYRLPPRPEERVQQTFCGT